jgi:hypothetical protein
MVKNIPKENASGVPAQPFMVPAFEQIAISTSLSLFQEFWPEIRHYVFPRY